MNRVDNIWYTLGTNSVSHNSSWDFSLYFIYVSCDIRAWFKASPMTTKISPKHYEAMTRLSEACWHTYASRKWPILGEWNNLALPGKFRGRLNQNMIILINENPLKSVAIFSGLIVLIFLVQKPEHVRKAMPIPWFLVPRITALPDHQQPRNLVCSIKESLPLAREDFNYLCHVSDDNW